MFNSEHILVIHRDFSLMLITCTMLLEKREKCRKRKYFNRHTAREESNIAAPVVNPASEEIILKNLVYV